MFQINTWLDINDSTKLRAAIRNAVQGMSAATIEMYTNMLSDRMTMLALQHKSEAAQRVLHVKRVFLEETN